VRTTLKRGAGRDWTGGREPKPEANGGGGGFRPPLTPVSRYGGHDHRGLRLTGRVLMWLFAFVLVAAGAFGGGVLLYLDESVATINQHSQQLQEDFQNAPELLTEAPEPGKATNAIVIGYDKRAGDEHTVGLSDTVMLVRADPTTNTISLLSFPRDLEVDHPGCAANPTPWRGKLNEAFALCGATGTVATVKQLTQLDINYVITVDFHGFKELVNKVGGVYVDVDQRYYNPAGSGYAKINLKPGYQKLTGGAALDYARFRHTDSDFHRIARQQQFVKSFKQAVRSEFSITKLPGIIKVFVDSVQVTRKGHDIDLNTLLRYARFVYELPSGHFFQGQLSVGDLTGTSLLETSTEDIQTAVRRFLDPDVEAAEKATVVASGGVPRTAAPRPEETSIEVLNGNGVEGSADTAAYLLGQLAYVAQSGGNALDDAGNAKWNYFETTILYDPAVAGAEAAAKAVGELFGDYRVAQVPAPDRPLDTMLRVIVGKTFHGTLAPATADDTPEHEPPQTVRDFDDVATLLRPLRGQLDFPLLVPLKRESSSSLDSEMPVRNYRLENHDALKIVYRTTRGYWGVEETSWEDAPIMDEPSTSKRVNGRELRLYYNGSKLHMIAFEEAGAVYWVTNTLLDDLSNETMLDIAKNLQPLSAAR
jgi:LCP family protein required for cell wall assembly